MEFRYNDGNIDFMIGTDDVKLFNKIVNKYIFADECQSEMIDEIVDKIYDAPNESIEIEKSEIGEIDDYMRTGYKIDADGKRRYKTRYTCTNCENRGTHYIPVGTKQVRCHHCKTELDVKRVYDEINQSRDNFGNWYVAGKFEARK